MTINDNVSTKQIVDHIEATKKQFIDELKRIGEEENDLNEKLKSLATHSKNINRAITQFDRALEIFRGDPTPEIQYSE